MSMTGGSLMEDKEIVTVPREKGASMVAEIAPTVPFAPGKTSKISSISGQSPESVDNMFFVR
jgi:hypothetical protein